MQTEPAAPTKTPDDFSGKGPRGSDPWAALRNHPAIRQLVDRLTLPSLEQWSPKRASDGLFLTFLEQQDSLGRRANRKRLPPRPQPRLRGVTVRSPPSFLLMKLISNGRV